MDKWVNVTDNPNYLVSETGRIRRYGSDSDKAVRKHDGYFVVDLYQDGRRSTKRVNRLVAEAFIPNPDDKPEVNHKDGNKLNNNVSNLEWTTKKENCEHAWRTGLVHPSRSMLGRRNPNSGRKPKRIRIVETGEIFDGLKPCEKAINGNNRHINDCLRGRQQTHRGYHFEYVD